MDACRDWQKLRVTVEIGLSSRKRGWHNDMLTKGGWGSWTGWVKNGGKSHPLSR